MLINMTLYIKIIIINFTLQKVETMPNIKKIEYSKRINSCLGR